MVKPSLQLLHMAAPCVVQAAPVLGEPFGQLHMLAAQDACKHKYARARAHTHTHTHTHMRGEKGDAWRMVGQKQQHYR